MTVDNSVTGFNETEVDRLFLLMTIAINKAECPLLELWDGDSISSFCAASWDGKLVDRCNYGAFSTALDDEKKEVSVRFPRIAAVVNEAPFYYLAVSGPPSIDYEVAMTTYVYSFGGDK